MLIKYYILLYILSDKNINIVLFVLSCFTLVLQNMEKLSCNNCRCIGKLVGTVCLVVLPFNLS